MSSVTRHGMSIVYVQCDPVINADMSSTIVYHDVHRWVLLLRVLALLCLYTYVCICVYVRERVCARVCVSVVLVFVIHIAKI
jgi:hypothetical protein